MNIELLKILIKKAEENEDCKELYPATIELITNLISINNLYNDIEDTKYLNDYLYRLEDALRDHRLPIIITKKEFVMFLKDVKYNEKRRIYRLIENYFEKNYIIDFEKFPKGLCGPAVFSFFENFKKNNYSFYNLELLIIFQYELNFIYDYFRAYRDELEKFLPNYAIYNDCNYHLQPSSPEEIIPFIERFSNEQHCPVKVNKYLIEECDKFFTNYLITLSTDKKISITEKQIEEAFIFTKNKRIHLVDDFLI